MYNYSNRSINSNRDMLVIVHFVFLNIRSNREDLNRLDRLENLGGHLGVLLGVLLEVLLGIYA
jgi:hypothetical protein